MNAVCLVLLILCYLHHLDFFRKENRIVHYKFLLFDIDDTLLDFEVAQENAFKLFLADYDITFTPEIYEAYNQYNQNLWRLYEDGTLQKSELLRTRFPNFLKRFGVDIRDGKDADDCYRQYLAKGNQLIDGVLPLVERASMQYTLGVVTNGVSLTQRTRLENNGLLSYFPHIFISDELGYQKPDRRFFDVVMDTLNITNPSDVLLIGDNLTADIFGAQQVGFHTCWVNKNNVEMTLSVPPTMMITTVSELSKHLF